MPFFVQMSILLKQCEFSEYGFMTNHRLGNTYSYLWIDAPEPEKQVIELSSPLHVVFAHPLNTNHPIRHPISIYHIVNTVPLIGRPTNYTDISA